MVTGPLRTVVTTAAMAPTTEMVAAARLAVLSVIVVVAVIGIHPRRME
jgi:hypothetical protein